MPVTDLEPSLRADVRDCRTGRYFHPLRKDSRRLRPQTDLGRCLTQARVASCRAPISRRLSERSCRYGRLSPSAHGPRPLPPDQNRCPSPGQRDPSSSSGHTASRSSCAMRALARSLCGRRVDPVIVSRRVISVAKFTSTFGPCRKAICTKSTVFGQRLQVARDIIATADHIKDQIRPAFGLHHLHEIRIAVIDRSLGAEINAGRTFVDPSLPSRNTRAPKVCASWIAVVPIPTIRHAPETALRPSDRRA